MTARGLNNSAHIGILLLLPLLAGVIRPVASLGAERRTTRVLADFETEREVAAAIAAIRQALRR